MIWKHSTINQIEIVFSSDYIWVMSPFIWFLIVLIWLEYFSMMVHCICMEAIMRPDQVLCFNNNNI